MNAGILVFLQRSVHSSSDRRMCLERKRERDDLAATAVQLACEVGERLAAGFFVCLFFFRSFDLTAPVNFFKALAKTLTPVGNPIAGMIDGRPPRDSRCILNKGSLQMTDLQSLQMRNCALWERLILTKGDIEWAATLFGAPCYSWVQSKVASECCCSFKLGGGAQAETNDVSHTCGCSCWFFFFFWSYWLFVVSNHSDLWRLTPTRLFLTHNMSQWIFSLFQTPLCKP